MTKYFPLMIAGASNTASRLAVSSPFDGRIPAEVTQATERWMLQR